jgi:hypothetical protein
MPKQTRNFVRAFLQGLTGAGLFGRLSYPGAPREFVDSRSLDEIHASGEFERTRLAYQRARMAKQRDDARRRTAEQTEDESVHNLRH